MGLTIYSTGPFLFLCLFCMKLSAGGHSTSLNTNANAEDSEIQQQIRHGRSRSHFIRSNRRLLEPSEQYGDGEVYGEQAALAVPTEPTVPVIPAATVAREDIALPADNVSEPHTDRKVIYSREHEVLMNDEGKQNGPATRTTAIAPISVGVHTDKKSSRKSSFTGTPNKRHFGSRSADVTEKNGTNADDYLHFPSANVTDEHLNYEQAWNGSDQMPEEMRSGPRLGKHAAAGPGELGRNRTGGRHTYIDDDRNNAGVDSDADDLDNELVSEETDFYLETGVKTSEGPSPRSGHVDIVTRFLRIVESQHLLGENCTAGTEMNLGEGVVDRYAQERFRVEADVAVNRANMLTRVWKYADPTVVMSEYLLHASVFSMVEFDDDIFAAGNCYDQYQYKDYWLFCPYAYRLPEGPILVKDLAVEYKYLSNTSEWFYIARKNAENVIRNYNQFSRGYNTYTWNESAHTDRIPDEILSVTYEDGKWSKPYYDCGGGNIWMLTYTVPFFGFQNNTYFFKGTSGIDIDLRRVDIDQCPLPKDSTQLNIFAASDKCKKRTTDCVPLAGLGFRRGSYKCVCRRGFYFPDTKAERRYYNGTVIEEEYEKLMLNEDSQYSSTGVFECLPCAEGCESCEDDRPCVVSLNWVMRTAILILSCVVICCLPIVVLFTWKYGNVKVVRAASPVLLRVITLGAFFIYSTILVMYPQPNVYTCTVRVWLREIGFSLTYGALMLKTWRISVIFRVRSAKAVKITDLNLMKRLGVIVAVFSVLLMIRTLVAPPHVIVGRTADDLKAYLCKTDWWDHSFTTMEVLFLVWGIRLCIVVRKAPSEFNESKFISMAIYNEFLLSIFLNISMLFLQSPANPDLLYIIFFCHTQLTVTLLLCLIFGSKAYMVFRGTGKTEESSGMMSKTHAAKFLNKPRSGNSQYTSTNSSAVGLDGRFTDQDVQEEFRRLYTQLELLKEKNMRFGNRHLAAKISAMQDAAARLDSREQALTEEAEGSAHSKNHSGKLKSLEHNKHNSVLSGALVKPRVSVVAFATDQPSCSSAGLDRQRVEPKVPKTEACTSCSTASVVVHATGTPSDKENGTAAPVMTAGPVTVDAEPEVVIDNLKKAPTNPSPTDGSSGKSSSRLIKSGHARTHAIVINLDDKSRFTEEVTV